MTSAKYLDKTINSKKSILPLYRNDKSEKEIKETTSFTIATKILNISVYFLTKQGKDLYYRNFKSLKKEINEDLRRPPMLTNQ